MPLEELYHRGSTCVLWGHKATDMSIEELLIFIGFLDQVIEHERQMYGQRIYK